MLTHQDLHGIHYQYELCKSKEYFRVGELVTKGWIQPLEPMASAKAIQECIDFLMYYQFFVNYSFDLLSNIFPILGEFFVNNVVYQSNQFCKTYNKAKCYEKSQIFNL